VAAGQQLLGGLDVSVAPGRLADDLLVPVEPQPAQPVEDAVEPDVGAADRIGVLVAQQEGAALAAGEHPVEQRGARASDVERAGRRRAEANARRHADDDT
jgi:hypothetical protein